MQQKNALNTLGQGKIRTGQEQVHTDERDARIKKALKLVCLHK